MRIRTQSMILVDTSSGEQHELGRLRPLWNVWSSDSRYLWCCTQPEKPEEREWQVLDVESMSVVAAIGPEQLKGQSIAWVRFTAKGDRALLSTWRRVGLGDKSRTRHIWVAQPDGTGLEYLGKYEGHVLGWTHDGDLLIWNRESDGSIVRLEPDTGEERVIFAPPQ